MISLHSDELLKLFPQLSEVSEFYFNGVVIDTRKDCAGALFIAIKGENFDAHDFVTQARDKGAAAILVEHVVDIDIPQLIVEDCRSAMGKLANFWRHKVPAKVIAISGSNGKTTVKEMLGRILSSEHRTLMTLGNLNNDIGVPLTLFRLTPQHHFAVIEMGANHPHEIHNLLSIAEPDVVYVNNAQNAHVEGFGSRQGVIRAKGEMYQFSSPTAIAVFNEDEDAVDYWKSIAASSLHISFSLRQHSDITGAFVQQAHTLHIEVTQGHNEADTEIQMQGLHNVQNAVAAITLATACGLSLEQAAEGLGGFTTVNGRQKFYPGVNKSLIIDDSYNANPGSLIASVNVLCAQRGVAWLALGDMAELGADAQRLHEQALTVAKENGVVKFFALGTFSCKAAKLFGDDGHCFENHEDMARYISARLHSGINLLVKGSRSAHMEKLVTALKEASTNNGETDAV
jgi:UDP-N-acetylmuramoyl-tripeptide--D-alanyl-D-alanine ligase